MSNADTLELMLPRRLRTSAIVAGPPEGWHWPVDVGAGAVRVCCERPPLNFVEPVAITMLGAWASHQRKLGREVIIGESLQSRTAFESGLLSALAGRAQGGVIRSRSQFLRLTTEREAQDQLSDFVEGVVGTANAAERIASYCLGDLAQNVFDHACTGGEGAFCSISFDKRTSRVRLAVADCGRGVPATIKPHYEGDLDDRDSLLLALEPEFSGASARDEINRGVGLYFVRRLALAASGAFCAVTEGLSARASARTPSDFAPSISRVQRWQGTAIAVTFVAEGADYSGPMQAIIDEVEGRGPRYADIHFFAKSEHSAEWHSVKINCDRGKFAMDRERAHEIARTEALPLLERGAKVELDFTGIAKATQPFCHALVVPLIRHGGDGVLARLRFVGCSARTRSPIRFAINFVTNDDH